MEPSGSDTADVIVIELLFNLRTGLRKGRENETCLWLNMFGVILVVMFAKQ